MLLELRPPSRLAMVSQSSTRGKSNGENEPRAVIIVSERTSFFSGLLAGIVQAGLFNPVDRALYLSVKNHVPFLSPSNFTNPYLGFSQSVLGRALSGGLYYPLEHYYSSLVPPNSGPWANFLAGTAAGMTNALILNPITAVKYKTWSRMEAGPGTKTTMLCEARGMWNHGGVRPFCNGLLPTLCRDVVFGGCYTVLRLEFQYYGLPPEYQWAGNMFAAALATVLSGPLNLARNVQYSTSSKHVQPSIRQVLLQLYLELNSKPSIGSQLQHLQARLRIGWGTARVAVGMAFGQFVYEELMWTMAIKPEEVEKPPKLNRDRRPSLVRLRQTRLMEDRHRELVEQMQLEDM